MARLLITINPARFGAAESLEVRDVVEVLQDLAYRVPDMPHGVTVPLLHEGEQVGEATYCLANERHDNERPS